MSLKNNHNSIFITLNPNIYPLESILNTCYVFIDSFYIFLDSGSKGNIKVYIKGKKVISKKQLELLKGKFNNELLYNALRYKISKNNKKIREYIIGRALYSALPDSDLSFKIDNNKKLDYIDDPLGIAIPWEEKYGKSSKTKV